MLTRSTSHQRKMENKLYLVYYPDRVLDRPTEPITSFQPGLKEFVEAMYDVMRRHNGIGLAAPQVGYGRSVLVTEVNGVQATLINPIIQEASGKQQIEEGCLSFPGITVPVERFDKIRVKYQDVSGETHFGEW